MRKLYRHGQRPGLPIAHAYPDGNANTDVYANGDSDGNSHANSDANTNANTYSSRYGHAHVHAFSIPRTDRVF